MSQPQENTVPAQMNSVVGENPSSQGLINPAEYFSQRGENVTATQVAEQPSGIPRLTAM